MIEINKLSGKDINRKVVYQTREDDKEYGRITSFNHKLVFVDYSNSGRGIATNPEHLKFDK